MEYKINPEVHDMLSQFYIDGMQQGKLLACDFFEKNMSDMLKRKELGFTEHQTEILMMLVNESVKYLRSQDLAGENNNENIQS